MIYTYADPTAISTYVIDPVRSRASEIRVHKIVDLYELGVAFRLSSRPLFLKSPTNSFFFSRPRLPGPVPRRQTPLHLSVQVFELGVPVWVVRPFLCLTVGLQAIAEFMQ